MAKEMERGKKENRIQYMVNMRMISQVAVMMTSRCLRRLAL